MGIRCPLSLQSWTLCFEIKLFFSVITRPPGAALPVSGVPGRILNYFDGEDPRKLSVPALSDWVLVPLSFDFLERNGWGRLPLCPGSLVSESLLLRGRVLTGQIPPRGVSKGCWVCNLCMLLCCTALLVLDAPGSLRLCLPLADVVQCLYTQSNNPP